jgi:hypothetical protein
MMEPILKFKKRTIVLPKLKLANFLEIVVTIM